MTMAATSTTTDMDSELRQRARGYQTSQKHLQEDLNLLNYLKKSSPTNSSTSLSLEQVLKDKLEEFISSTLTSLEEIFVATSTDTSLLFHTLSPTLSNQNRVSNARLVYQSLISLKSAPLDKKFDILDKILDEYYGNIFKNSKITSSNEKLLLGLEFIEAKFNYFLNAKSDEVLGLSSDNEKRGLVSQAFRDLNIQFHNYDNAVISGKSRLLHYWELPFPWRENKFIVYGYRFNNTYSGCIKSILQVHNETGNIWTHLLGFFLALYLTFYHFPSSEVFENASVLGKTVIGVFLLALIKCLVSSVCWHTFNSTSNLPVRSRFACIDYTGITVLITASIISTEYCSLYYHHTVRAVIMTISIALGLAGFVFTWTPTFDTPKLRPIRIIFFVSLAAMGLLSFLILAFYQGIMVSLKYYLPIGKSLGSYLSGVVFYGFLFPECCRRDVMVDKFDICDEILNELNDHDDLQRHFKVPDKTENHDCFTSLWWVDYCFSSHNIWHLFVVGGIFYHYTAILEMFSNIDKIAPLA